MSLSPARRKERPMTGSDDRARAAHIVDRRNLKVLDVLGPTLELLTEPQREEPGVMLGRIPPGVCVPLHSHPDPETFFILSGSIEALVWPREGPAWVPVRSGDVFHVPEGARHAFRNPSRVPVRMLVVSTPKLGRFFREIGRPLDPQEPPAWPPARERVAHLLGVARRYGYWNATAEENARVGLSLPSLPDPA
jgi:mannose-6-phosphate isomerase-like protein (cupin superfamily)